MINLLDPEQERQLRAGRLNVRLVRFFVLSLLIAVGVGSVYTAGFWLVTRDRDVAEQQQQAINQDLEGYTVLANSAKEYRQNLAVAKQILGNQMVFSTFLTDLGALMPTNTIVETLAISTASTSASTTGALSLATRAKNYDDVLNIKKAFETSALFSNVRIMKTSVPEKPDVGGIGAIYPYQATFEVVLNALKGTVK